MAVNETEVVLEVQAPAAADPRWDRPALLRQLERRLRRLVPGSAGGAPLPAGGAALGDAAAAAPAAAWVRPALLRRLEQRLRQLVCQVAEELYLAFKEAQVAEKRARDARANLAPAIKKARAARAELSRARKKARAAEKRARVASAK